VVVAPTEGVCQTQQAEAPVSDDSVVDARPQTSFSPNHNTPSPRHSRAMPYRKLGRTSSHRWAMLRNMVTSLVEHERIRTTTAKVSQ